MISYDEKYLDDAMKNLGEAFDYAVNDCQIDADLFLMLLISSGLADQFGSGNPKYVSGTSGTELVMDMVAITGLNIPLAAPQIEYDRSPEYWCGWILAYYQWKTGRSFRNILNNISMSEVLKLYPTLHEASEEKFVDTVNTIISRKETCLEL